MDEERPLQLLYEYAVQWSAFSNSVWKLAAMLAHFEELFNESYTTSWPEAEYKFKVYRMMTRIWGDVVLDQDMTEDLKDSFKGAIREYHKDRINHIKNKAVLGDDLPIQAVMNKFFQALVDTSINEKSVHYIGSTEVVFDRLYNMFEGALMKECKEFIKLAFESGYKSKTLKGVYSIFEEYSKTIKSFLPHKSQKVFEKLKCETTVKFIRYIICTRLKQFANLDFSKIEAKWNSTHESALEHVFNARNSMFLKHFYKVIDEKKFDKENFKKYWLVTSGTDAVLLIKFYDNAFASFDKLNKAFTAKDVKIRTHKQKAGIELPTKSKELTFTSLLSPIPESYIEKIISDYLGTYEKRTTRSLSNTEYKLAEPS